MISTRPKYDYTNGDWHTRRIHERTLDFLRQCKEQGQPVEIESATQIDSIYVNPVDKDIRIYFNKYFSYLPFRIESVDEIYKAMQEQMGWWYRNYSLEIFTIGTTIEQLVPNYYRGDKSAYDPSRKLYTDKQQLPLVRRISRPIDIGQGLDGRSIALWHSHGWYYNNELKRWEWQRPRLFQTVEDLLPFSITIPYLIPMLENAGANVFVPRERSLQVNEVIVDNDSSSFQSIYKEWVADDRNIISTGDESGFSIGSPPYVNGDNPFTNGSSRQMRSDTIRSSRIEWIPEIPETGKYAVYISYQHSDSSVQDAHYRVYHSGGETDFLINQQMGGGTWIYLGEFPFKEGLNSESGKVVLTNESEKSGQIISADAVRFGGGMGNIKRNLNTSKRARFLEGARYYLQYAGMPDSLVYNTTNGKDDYRDDYTGRGEWVNYLIGAPFGPNKNRNVEGLNIPIDLSCSFHTDAGIKDSSEVVGTLGIYSLLDEKGKTVYPDGVSRLAARDLTDITQTQIVRDIREKYDSDWTRRAMYNAKYSEAYRPNVPAMLIELFSHQNFTDMKYGIDPRFRFDMGRSIYKAILKFIATQYGYEYVVQPLPVTHFCTEFVGEKDVKLSWRPQLDSLEKSAEPDKYIVYTKRGDNGFDNGRVVKDTVCIVKNLKPGMNYSFKITAVNSGGESFPSEVLAVCWQENSRGRVLIVNGFDRICSPATVNEKDFKGFANFYDEGVPYMYDVGYTGRQVNFDPASIWLTNDSPGWGASYANYETEIIAGNTFDYSYTHGKALESAGYSYVSVSDEAVTSDCIQLNDYEIIDFIFGEEKTTSLPDKSDSSSFQIFPAKMQQKIKGYCKEGGNLFISGAYLGSDMFTSPKDTSADAKFAREILQYKLAAKNAARKGRVIAADTGFSALDFELEYNARFNNKIYKVEAPDAIIPANSDSARTILRYRENRFGAGISYAGNDYRLVLTAFPFETILGEEKRYEFMQYILNYFEKNSK